MPREGASSSRWSRAGSTSVAELILTILLSVAATWRTDTLVAPDGSKAALVVPSGKPIGTSRGFPLVVWLHGGIGANNPAKGLQAAPGFAPLADSGRFAFLSPSAWPASPWWSASARDRLQALVRMASSRPGVDASRIVLAGASDGGAGALWLAATTRRVLGDRLRGVAVWSTNPSVLESRGARLEVAGLTGIPVRWRAGTQDRLFAPQDIAIWWESLRREGVALDAVVDPLAGHDLADHKADLASFPAWLRLQTRP